MPAVPAPASDDDDDVPFSPVTDPGNGHRWMAAAVILLSLAPLSLLLALYAHGVPPVKQLGFAGFWVLGAVGSMLFVTAVARSVARRRRARRSRRARR